MNIHVLVLFILFVNIVRSEDVMTVEPCGPFNIFSAEQCDNQGCFYDKKSGHCLRHETKDKELFCKKVTTQSASKIPTTEATVQTSHCEAGTAMTAVILALMFLFIAFFIYFLYKKLRPKDSDKQIAELINDRKFSREFMEQLYKAAPDEFNRFLTEKTVSEHYESNVKICDYAEQPVATMEASSTTTAMQETTTIVYPPQALQNSVFIEDTEETTFLQQESQV